MSGIWADFDPRAKSRAKPAAPVMSLDQAEASLSLSAAQSSRRAPIDDHLDDAAPKESAEKSDTSEEPAEDSNTKLSGSPEPPAEEAAASSELQSPTIAEKSTGESLSNAGDDDMKQKESEKTEKPPSVSALPTGPQLATDEELDPLDPGSRVDTPVEAQPIEEAQLEAAGIAEAKQAPSGETVTSSGEEGADIHEGNLRKNSIAAMKELGDPGREKSPESSDGGGSPFDYQSFMTLLRSKSADPIARYIKSFLQEFSRGVWSTAQQEKIVADFHRFIAIKMRDHEPFASLPKSDRQNSMEGVEKLIMNRIYTRTYPPKMPPILRTDSHNMDLLRDQVFEEKLRLWGWLEGRHLDISEGYLKSSFIQLATTELGRLHQFKAPRDKMICVLNCSKVVWALIRQAQLEQNADSFLPLLIYVVIKAQPVHLVSNINYIQRFRAKEFQRGETAYYLSTLASAVAFIETLDASSLTIGSEEFEQRMADSAKAEQNRKLQEQIASEYALTHEEAPSGESSAAVLTASAGMLVERMKNFTTKFLEDLSTPNEGANQGNDDSDATASSGTDAMRQARRQLRADERAARDASVEDYRSEELQRQQFSETLITLQDMFPVLDKDVIEDVLRQNGTNVGSAVDICLALVESR